MTHSTTTQRSDRSESYAFAERMLPDDAVVGCRPYAANVLQLARRRKARSYWQDEGRSSVLKNPREAGLCSLAPGCKAPRRMQRA